MLESLAQIRPEILLMVSLGTFISTACYAVFVSIRYSEQRSDFRTLKQMLRSLVRQATPQRVAPLRSNGAQEVWNSLVTLSVRERSQGNTKTSLEEVLALGNRITSATDEVASAAEAVVNVLREKVGPNVVAIAVVLRDSESKELGVAAVHGVPRSRIEHTLLMHFDSLLDHNASNAIDPWGYWNAGNDKLQDYSTFGVSCSLSVPLRDEEDICGGIWIGFRHGIPLTPQRKTFVHAIATHAAASFCAAGRVREKSEKSKRERDFLIGISHDLRAPGSSALYALRDLLSGELGALTSEQHLRLSVIEQSLQNQLHLLGDIFDFAKHQKGVLEASPQLVNVRESLSNIIQSFTLSAERAGLELHCDVLPALCVSIDPRHLQRIISNFLSNAVKYTERGHISITCYERADNIEIIVEDTGIGIPENKRAQLFTEFTRFENTKGKPGVGLGLALTDALARLNEANVFYQPRAEGGSIFGVRVKKYQNNTYSNNSGALDIEAKAFTLNSILVIDDDPAACRNSIRDLDGMSSRFIPCSNCDEGIAIARELRPSLIISDLNIGALRAEKLLEALESYGMSIPVLLLTGSSNEEELAAIELTYGATTLQKPVNRELLRQTVRRMFLVASEQGESQEQNTAINA